MTHVGSLNAPDEEFTLQYARDVFSRRYEALRLWVVPRNSIQQIDDLDLLRPPFDRSYRRPDGYNVVPKLRVIKARVAASRHEAEVSK